MQKYPCETIVRYILPAFRSLLAKELLENHGFTQTDAAAKIGTTQAAISHYLSSKRGDKFAGLLENDPQVKSTIDEIVSSLLRETSPDVMEKFCDLCLYLRTHNVIDSKQSI